ncbi:MAG: DUF4097 family beta strand repeat-containing protein [Gemmatimonadales bacterium]|jgi:DUF4097 and DUF4098 domain-containing protein YvlB|nr:DUF4097 family beta strand repeat-containing protein [Gemmatimonadales bacterium]
MLLSMVGLTLALLAMPDTTVPASRGQRLDVELFGGSVTVRSWGRDAVRIEGAADDQQRLTLTSNASRLGVEVTGRHGPAHGVDVVITAPAWMALNVSGVELDLTVEGCKCAVTAETVGGDIVVRGAEGVVTLSSVEGGITVAGVAGTVRANSVNDDVVVRGVSGDVSVEAVNGDVLLEQLRSDNVSASSVNGDITFDGEVRAKGRYALSSHQGDVTATVPAGAGATVRVNTFNGDFTTDFPVTLSGDAGRRKLTFALGSGSAAIDLESFSGDIRLRRPGARPDR